jgi:hypothetical protein
VSPVVSGVMARNPELFVQSDMGKLTAAREEFQRLSVFRLNVGAPFANKRPADFIGRRVSHPGGRPVSRVKQSTSLSNLRQAHLGHLGSEQRRRSSERRSTGWPLITNVAELAGHADGWAHRIATDMRE